MRNAARRGYKHSFSAYVAWLIERDAEGDVKRETVHTDEPSAYPVLKVAENPEPLAAKRKQEPRPGEPPPEGSGSPQR